MTAAPDESLFAKPFRLHHSGQVFDGVEFPGGRVMVLDDPQFGICTGAESVEALLAGYHRSHIEWPGPRRCRIPGCRSDAVRHRTLCSLHRGRTYRHGDPLQERALPDPFVVAAAVQERRALPGMTRKERTAAGLALTGLGLPATEIGRIFNVTPRTVTRWRAAATKELT
ncbi:hypothetical protein [Streptomyces sp. NBC_01506]|uniref:hypothetical protein n=1 Tax=Streptomyces sp. NBC_01506 TaxID=2903887 RepID=UPI0038658CC1